LRKLHVTQILDERQSAQGKLIVEVKASGLGLVGDIDQVIALKPEGFDITQITDPGVSVGKFDADADPTAVASERTWLVTLQAKPGATPAAIFRFAKSARDDAEMTYQRYVDADLATVGEEVPLDHKYAGRDWRWAWWVGATALALAMVGFLLVRALRRAKRQTIDETRLPRTLTAFSVSGLLYDIQRNGQLDAGQREELDRAIARLERRYFAEQANGDGEIDLRQIAETWLRRAEALKP
jgi:hypothetical protein